MTCGQGVRHRELECVVKEQTVDESLCSEAQKPLRNDRCVLLACAEWEVEPWEKVITVHDVQEFSGIIHPLISVQLTAGLASNGERSTVSGNRPAPTNKILDSRQSPLLCMIGNARL